MKRLFAPGSALLLVLFAAAACSDGPTSPVGPRLGAVEPNAGDGQSAPAGEPVATAPAVRVLDTRGAGLKGVTVSFAVTEGGGSLGQEKAVTDANGIATAGQWTLGVEGENQVEARVGVLAPVRFTAVALAPPGAPPEQPPVSPPASPPVTPPSGTGGSAFDIVARFVAPATARQQQAVQSAVARWRSIIVTDLPDIPMDAAAGSCFAGQPRLNETVDDLLLYVEFVPIDGPSGTLGESGPCYIRSDSGLPVVGYVKLDTADLDRMEQSGTLDDVVLHEIGHVLGIGTLWTQAGLLQGAGGTDPRFTGANAEAAYARMGGTDPNVAVENTGETGTRDGHWRESVFGNELMTGYISGVPNPLSALTIASLQDIGYGASQSAASSYVLGGTSAKSTAAVDLRGHEKLHKPKFKVDRAGRKQQIQP